MEENLNPFDESRKPWRKVRGGAPRDEKTKAPPGAGLP
jgi:hypothetical protein